MVAKTKKIKNTKTDNPKLCTKLLADGVTESLYLLYNYGYNASTGKSERKKEFLHLTIKAKPRNDIEKRIRQETLEKAESIRWERGQALLQDKEGYRLKQRTETNLYIYWGKFIEETNVKDKRLLKAALDNFKAFISESEEYQHLKAKIAPKQLDKDMMQKFAWYLEDNHKGQGVETYWRRFKRLVNFAVEHDVIAKSPCRGISVSSTSDMLAKDILSADELALLFSTHYRGENPEIRRAFAMTCYSGIRFCDIVKLTYSNIDLPNKMLKFRQSKVSRDSSASGVTIPLNDTLLGIIGTKVEDAQDDFIFHLPSPQMCLKAIRHWTEKAGIKKHITWHCGRHSFATNLLSNGANIKTVSSLLGHSSLKFTEIYVRAVDSLKREALDTLPSLNIDNI